MIRDQKVWAIKIAYERDVNGGRLRSIKKDGKIKSLASNFPSTLWR